MTSEIEDALARVKSWCGITTPKARTLWNEDLRTILTALTASQAEVERLTRERDAEAKLAFEAVNALIAPHTWMVRALTAEAALAALKAEVVDVVEASVGAHTKLLREWMYAPFPIEAQVLGGMSPPKGPFADAAASIEAVRAMRDFITKHGGGS